MSEHSLSCDTSILLYLGRIGQLGLLPTLFEAVFVPAQVVLELDMGRLLRVETVDPRQLTWVTLGEVSQKELENLPPNRLGPGERSVIAYARRHGHCLGGLDDRLARLLAEDLGLKAIQAFYLSTDFTDDTDFLCSICEICVICGYFIRYHWVERRLVTVR